MTDSSDLIQRLADELDHYRQLLMDDRRETHALAAEARAYLAKPNPKGPTDEELNSKSSPNNLQIRSSDLDVTIALVQQWTDEIYGGPGAVVGSDDICLAKLAAQYGADQELEACVDWISKQDWTWTSAQLRAARRPKPPSLKEEALEELDGIATVFRMFHSGDLVCDKIRRALKSIPDPS